MKRVSIYLGAVLVLGVLGAWLLRPGGDHPLTARASAAESTESAHVEAFTVEERDVPIILSLPGTLRPKMEASVSSKILARIESITVREGDLVRKGQVLVVLDSRDLEAGLRQAEASLAAARSGSEAAQTATDLETRQADARVAAATAHYEAAKARLEQARAGLRQQEKRQASLAVQQAEADLRLAEADYQRYKSLYDQNAIPKQALDQAATRREVAASRLAAAKEQESLAMEGTRSEEVRVAEQAFEAAKAELQAAKSARLGVDIRKAESKASLARVSQASAATQAAKVAMSYRTVVAPFDGVVTKRLADPGSTAAPGVPLLQIESSGPLRLEASTPETALRHVRLGVTSARVVLDALGGERMGRAIEIVPSLQPSTRTAIVRFEVAREPGMYSGMYGRAELRTGSKRAITIPESAIVRRSGLEYVKVLDAQNRPRLRLITTGERTPDGVIVLTGLRAGERVQRNGGDN
ncbi:MAG: hypothetical protein AMXMBFR61_22960 [Fimbriimonadales bacterium]